MSWLDKLNNVEFTIVTGDGEIYTPKWKNATKELEFNISEFNFVDVDGSLIVRRSAKGRVFPLEFYFDGANAVDTGNKFEISARNINRWTLKHPFYGNIKCQPVKLTQDNTSYNVSKFTVEVIETLTEGYPKPIALPEDEVLDRSAAVNELQASAFEINGEFDRNDLEAVTNQQAAIFTGIIENPDELVEFKAHVDNALNTITNVNSSALDVIRSMQAYIAYPARVAQTVQARYNTFKEALDSLVATISGVASNIRNISSKNEFEAVGGALIAAAQVAVTTGIDEDYKTKESVLAQVENLQADFESYLSILDENQTDRADAPDSYLPNFDALNALNELYGLSTSNLFAIAFGAQQTRVYINEKDSNVVLLTHKFMGLDQNDENIQRFIDVNNIQLNELLIVKKGREIIYYI